MSDCAFTVFSIEPDEIGVCTNCPAESIPQRLQSMLGGSWETPRESKPCDWPYGSGRKHYWVRSRL